MKKLLAAGLALTMSLSLTACMGGTANSSSAASSGSESSSQLRRRLFRLRRVYNYRYLPADGMSLWTRPPRGSRDALTELLGEENAIV